MVAGYTNVLTSDVNVYGDLSVNGEIKNPTLSGVPTAPTASSETSTTQIATTAFVKTAVSELVDNADGAYDTLKKIQDMMVEDDSAAASMLSVIATKANSDSPVFTGTVSGITKQMITGLENVENTTDLEKPVSTATLSALNLKGDKSNVITLETTKANLDNPTFTGVPLAPTAVSGTNTTQVATTAFVNSSINTYKNVVDALADNTYCLYMIYTMFMRSSTTAGPNGLNIIIRFNKNQTFKVISNGPVNNTDIFNNSEQEYSYTIVSEPNGLNGAVISFTHGVPYSGLSFNRMFTITFDTTYNKIVNFNESLENFTIKSLANTIVNGITTSDSESDFLTKFLASYTSNSGSTLYSVDASGNYTSDSSGTRVNIGTIYTSAGSDWRRQVAISMMSTNSNVIAAVGSLTRFRLATMLYDGETITGCYTVETPKYCGIKMNVEYYTPSIQQNDIYYNINMPMTIHNESKRLNGKSDGRFEPDQTSFLSKNCLEIEKVAASGSIPAHVKHITVRGLDVVAHNYRMHFDPSQMHYMKGRSISYCRHKQSLLDDTFWYPDGPEFRINLNPELTITKLLCNDIEVPLHLIKRKSWDNYVKDTYAITFNIAAAIAQAGIEFKYDTDPSGNYVKDGLNKIEIWYEGKFANNNYSTLITDLFKDKNVGGGVKYKTTPSSNNRKLSSLMKNTSLYENSKSIGSKYGVSEQTITPSPKVSVVQDRMIIINNRFYDSSMIIGTTVSSGIEYEPNDQAQTHLFLLVPSNDNAYDKFYLQVEIMCPKQFYASTGGKHLVPIDSIDKTCVLYRFVPGAKAEGPDYRSTYSTALSFRIKEYPVRSETITVHDTSGNLKTIPYYTEIPSEMIPFYNNTNNSYNSTNMTRIIQSIENIMGPYPFDTYGTSIGNLEPGNGMEYMEMSGYSSKSLDWFVVIHETFHQWWQDMVSFDYHQDWWIDEGLNQFCNYFTIDDLNLDTSGNLFYVYNVNNKIQDIEYGWSEQSLAKYSGTYGSYDLPAFIYATMYYNFGADFKVDSSGKFVVKPVDSSGNIAMNIHDVNDVVVSAGLLNPVTRQLFIDTSGTIRYVSSDNKVIDSAGIVISEQSVSYMLGYVDNSGVMLDNSGNQIVVLTKELTSGLKLPGAALSQYYAKNSSNTNFWNCIKYVLNAFKGTGYTFSSFKNAIGDFVDSHKAEWGNKWPSTKAEISELFDQMVNQGGNKQLGGDFYTFTIDPAYVPAGVLTNPVHKVRSFRINDTVNYSYNVWSLKQTSQSAGSINVDFTAPFVYLKDSSGNELQRGDTGDFAINNVFGKVVLMLRKGPDPLVRNAQKQINAYNAGALAVIYYNNESGDIGNDSIFSTSQANVRIPLLTISDTLGAYLKTVIDQPGGATVKIKGTFDVSIV